MPSKRQREQWNKARAASVQTFKKRKLEASSLLNSAQLLIDDDKLNKSDTVDTEAEFGDLSRNEGLNEGDHASQDGGHHDAKEPDFQGVQSVTEGAAELERRHEGLNEGDHASQDGGHHDAKEPDLQGVQSVIEGAAELECRHEGLNEVDHASQEGGHHDAKEPDLQGVQSVTEGAAELECRPKEIKWSKEGGTELRGGYGKGSRSTRGRQKRSARELELGASKTPKLGALWQGHTCQVTVSASNTSEGLHMPFHLQNDAEKNVNPAMERTVSKDLPLTEEEPRNALGRANEVGSFSEVRTTQQLSMVGAEPGFIPGEDCGTGNHDGNELHDDLASLQ